VDDKEKHKRKMVAPVVVTTITVVYLMAYAVAFSMFSIPPLAKFIGFAVFIALALASVFMCRERIGEIRSGEEDDIGKY
jgi:uncharacterized membrane protein